MNEKDFFNLLGKKEKELIRQKLLVKILQSIENMSLKSISKLIENEVEYQFEQENSEFDFISFKTKRMIAKFIEKIITEKLNPKITESIL